MLEMHAGIEETPWDRAATLARLGWCVLLG
jgi:hypothetical protein